MRTARRRQKAWERGYGKAHRQKNLLSGSYTQRPGAIAAPIAAMSEQEQSRTIRSQESARCHPKCRGCSLPSPHVAKRRKLSSPATKHVIPVLTEIAERMNPGVTATLVVAGSFICVLCFRRLEGVIKLRHQLAEREKKIADYLEKVLFHSLLSPGLDSEVPVSSAVCSPPPAAQVRKEDTRHSRRPTTPSTRGTAHFRRQLVSSGRAKRTSTLNKAHPKKTRREKFVRAANQPECEYDQAESRMVCTTLSLG